MALYEASMTVLAMTLPDFEGIDFVTIAPTAGRGLGYVQARYKDLIKFQKAMFNRLSVFDHICVQLAPRAADELWNGEDQLSTIWAKAANKARLDARNLVLGCIWDKYYGLNNFWISERNNELDLEAIRILDLCYERTKTILEENRGLMNAVVDKLLEQKSLTRKELDNLVALHGLSPQPTPPSLFDIRSDKLLELQNILDKELALQGST